MNTYVQSPSRIPTSSRSTTLKGLLRSTISPTDKLIITQVLLDAEKELKNYQVEISRLRTAILTLESKQEGVKRMMDKYRSLLSPIHRVPPEVLKNIFEYSCRINHLNMGSLPPAMTLSAVCGRWRELVLNTPSLWSSISIDYLYWERGSCEFLNRLTCRFMERSRTSPLTLNLEFCAFDFNEADDDAISTVEALVHNCSRWYDVTWCFRRQAMNNSMFAPIRGHLPMLQYLDIRADEEGSDEDELSWGLFSECPSLHSVSLAIGNPLSDSIDLPWQRIMSLTIDAGAANPDDILRVLSICPSIRRLELPSIYGFTIEPTVVRPSQLESLSITAYKSEHLSLLPHLTTPRLSSIEICGGYLGRHFWGPDTWDECLFTSFLVRSSCTITSLHLRWLPITDTQVLPLLELLPSLRTLRLQECTRTYPRTNQKNSIVTRTFLNRLTMDCESLVTTLVPRLIHLELLVVNNGLEQQALMEMLSSRWFPDPSHASCNVVESLKSFSLTVVGMREGSTHDPECFALLQYFRDSGLLVTTSYKSTLP
ncbi:hypothetical protein Moror_17382 [Moniliophthora roreri MCA 2997]|uniref:F-box domain-containing protein n=1 Tax=Moniliophthora roreri (strain MCA 2997) TaxID=1381753 RepID=V2XY28_MONRO|nr:hypothetical protein Moror_17382 [Moniliophthora roreri MCA 2997]